MSTSEIRDGDWSLFDYDPVYKRSVWINHDRASGQMHFRIDYEISGLLEANKQAYNDAPDNWAGEYMHHIAKIPLNLWYDELEQMQGDPRQLDLFLNDPDKRAFRTKKGHVG